MDFGCFPNSKRTECLLVLGIRICSGHSIGPGEDGRGMMGLRKES